MNILRRFGFAQDWGGKLKKGHVPKIQDVFRQHCHDKGLVIPYFCLFFFILVYFILFYVLHFKKYLLMVSW